MENENKEVDISTILLRNKTLEKELDEVTKKLVKTYKNTKLLEEQIIKNQDWLYALLSIVNTGSISLIFSIRGVDRVCILDNYILNIACMFFCLSILFTLGNYIYNIIIADKIINSNYMTTGTRPSSSILRFTFHMSWLCTLVGILLFTIYIFTL